MISMDEYLPVPTMRRDENSLPPMTRFVSPMALASLPLSPAHRSDDLHPVAVVQHGRLVRALRRHLAIHRHRGVLPLDAQVRQQPVDAQAVGDLQVLAVDHDLHKQNGRALSRVRPLQSLPSCPLRWDYPDQVRGVPGRTRFSGILPPRRRTEYTTAGHRTTATASISMSMPSMANRLISIRVLAGLLAPKYSWRTWLTLGRSSTLPR